MAGVLAGATFWAFVAALVFIGAWRMKKIETIRHETIRLLIEKNQIIDAETLTQLFRPHWIPSHESGNTYRMMKVAGTVVIALGLGLCMMGFCFAFLAEDKTALGFGGPAALLVILGAGIMFAARFMPRPPAKDPETEVTKTLGNGSEL